MRAWILAIGIGSMYMMRSAVQTVDDVKKLFNYEASRVEPWVDSVLERAQEKIEILMRCGYGECTFEGVVRAFDNITADVIHASQIVQTLSMVSPDLYLRDICQKAAVRLEEFYVENITHNQPLFEVLKKYQQKNEQMSDEQKHYLNEVIKAFAQAGVGASSEIQDEVKRIKKELALLTLAFETNINEDTRTIAVDKKDLDGLSEGFIANLRLDPVGKCLLGADYPTYVQVMENCSVEATRKALWTLYAQRAYPKNSKILAQVIMLRDKLARLLGAQSYAHLIINESMAQSPERVEQFIENIIERCLPKAQYECPMLGIKEKVKPWNLAFIKNEFKRTHLACDEERIAEYFPVEHTIAALLGIYEEFLGLTFKQLPAEDFWHSDVRLIAVYDQEKLAGYLLLDLFPRPNKYTHACQITIVPALKESTHVPVAVVLANFPQSVDPGYPSLLKRNDVITFFHEFGHAIHALFGATEMYGCSGTNVKMDFVEMPSQMLEEWMWEADILKRVSKHYKTGESLPSSLIERIKQLKHFDSGDATLRQATFALLSLECFKPGEDKNVESLRRTINSRVRPYVEQEDEDRFEASFGHLMGYGPQYYGYLWSKVYALDMFSHIKKHGLLDKKIGRHYLCSVLGKGGSCEPHKLLEDFLGRTPHEQPFFESLGL